LPLAIDLFFFQSGMEESLAAFAEIVDWCGCLK
jgi:hypothetical protein